MDSESVPGTGPAAGVFWKAVRGQLRGIPGDWGTGPGRLSGPSTRPHCRPAAFASPARGEVPPLLRGSAHATLRNRAGSGLVPPDESDPARGPESWGSGGSGNPPPYPQPPFRVRACVGMPPLLLLDYRASLGCMAQGRLARESPRGRPANRIASADGVPRIGPRAAPPSARYAPTRSRARAMPQLCRPVLTRLAGRALARSRALGLLPTCCRA
jgi:hypothetical protein